MYNLVNMNPRQDRQDGTRRENTTQENTTEDKTTQDETTNSSSLFKSDVRETGKGQSSIFKCVSGQQ
jgi:hypothetical protein